MARSDSGVDSLESKLMVYGRNNEAIKSVMVDDVGG